MDLSAYQPSTKTHSSSNNTANNSTSSTSASANHDMAKIFVGGLSWQTTEETLRYHFEQYGEVVSVEVMRDRVTGDPRGFAFVVFKDDATIDLVLKNLPHEINHKAVDVKRAQARGMAPPSIHKDGDGTDDAADTTGKATGFQATINSSSSNNYYGKQESSKKHSKELTPEQLQNKIFVGGLPLHLDKEGLNELFTQFGPVVDAIIMMDVAQGRSRGFGFVTFLNGSGGAQKALAAQPIYIDNKYVEIKLATPKGDQQDQHYGGQKGKFQNHHGAPSGLRNAAESAAAASMSKGEFAGLAASYGRNGYRAGYGTISFGSAGWNVQGWEDISRAPEISGFSFDLVEKAKHVKQSHTSKKKKSSSGATSTREAKRQKHS